MNNQTRANNIVDAILRELPKNQGHKALKRMVEAMLPPEMGAEVFPPMPGGTVAINQPLSRKGMNVNITEVARSIAESTQANVIVLPPGYRLTRVVDSDLEEVAEAAAEEICKRFADELAYREHGYSRCHEVKELILKAFE